jgi:endonuclease YncB( thermonuclease family)
MSPAPVSMPPRKGNAGSFRVILLLVIALGLWLRDAKTGKNSPPPSRPSSSATEKSSPQQGKQGGYEVLRSCQWVENRQNDGDSFFVRLPDGREVQIRLYYVDCPESQFRSYRNGQSNHERISDQARFFGITPEQAVEIGQEAKEYTHKLLSGKSFTLYTRWEDPFGDHRYHAFIDVGDGSMLHEKLVSKGYVRIYTRGADLPDGTSVTKHTAYLRELEAKAKSQRLGGWGFAR